MKKQEIKLPPPLKPWKDIINKEKLDKSIEDLSKYLQKFLEANKFKPLDKNLEATIDLANMELSEDSPQAIKNFQKLCQNFVKAYTLKVPDSNFSEGGISKEDFENIAKRFGHGSAKITEEWITSIKGERERYIRGQRLLFDWDPATAHLLSKEEKDKLFSGEWVENLEVPYISTRERYNYLDEYLSERLERDEALPLDLVEEYNLLVKTIHSKLPIEDDAENKEVS